jgi:hypothetical protein
MNERIQELIERSGLYLAPDNPEVFDKELEFFAELIVRECIKSLWTEECHTSDLAVEEYNRNSKKIKQHFGEEL